MLFGKLHLITTCVADNSNNEEVKAHLPLAVIRAEQDYGGLSVYIPRFHSVRGRRSSGEETGLIRRFGSKRIPLYRSHTINAAATSQRYTKSLRKFYLDPSISLVKYKVRVHH